MRSIATFLALVTLTQAGELHQAVRPCDGGLMRKLLSRHPSLNESDENGMTPLQIAVSFRQTECVALLLKAGADRNARDRQGRTILEATEDIADPRDRAMMAYMVRNFYVKGPQEPVGPKPWSLEYSAMRRQPDVTKMLLTLGADPNLPGTGGTTPLADAALKGDVESLRILLAHGARPHAISNAGTQPIHDAALGDNAEVIRELVTHGADVNARTREALQTPLHLAASMGKRKAVESLLSLGADPKIKDANGRTPIEAAERAGQTDVVTFLRKLP
ncbi:MAG: ankyrin repeat domain-containing protein [Bryobacteraceae bacterium]|nr:ankyrin repeat domain-containing protein [Bryobacteraceae bacterium]